MNEKQNGGEVFHLDSTATSDDLQPVSPEPEPPVIDLLDHSSIECSWASHFNAQIAAIQNDLEVFKSSIMINLSSAVVDSTDTISKLQKENVFLRRELTSQ